MWRCWSHGPHSLRFLRSLVRCSPFVLGRVPCFENEREREREREKEEKEERERKRKQSQKQKQKHLE